MPEATQADYYEQAFELAACQPNVIAVYIFHLFDEADLNRWQSGPYYTDTKAKSSLDAIADAAKKARDGKLADWRLGSRFFFDELANQRQDRIGLLEREHVARRRETRGTGRGRRVGRRPDPSSLRS